MKKYTYSNLLPQPCSDSLTTSIRIEMMPDVKLIARVKACAAGIGPDVV